MASVNTAGGARSLNYEATTVQLPYAITSFAIPTINAECIIDETETVVTYRPPEVTDIVDHETREIFQTARVPVMKGEAQIGYIPLPMRYQAVWLELSYCIVLYTQMWRLWAQEEKNAKRKSQRENAAILRRNCGAFVAQHMLARLLAVDELVSLSHDTVTPGEERVRILDEWKIRWCRDWFNTTYDEVARTGAKFLNADPIRPENQAFFEGDWNIQGDGKGFLAPPQDLEKWFHGQIDGLDRAFKAKLKRDALATLKKPDLYTETHYNSQARLPARWHEGHKPAPYFWSEKQWNWVAEGNSFWDTPIDLLFYILTEDPPYSSFQQFMQNLNSLLHIVVRQPQIQQVCDVAQQLWMGEMTWREFVDAMMNRYLQLPDAKRETSEKPDPKNVFNTLEARLVLEGYIRRHKEDEVGKPWDEKDVILWQSLSRVTVKKYKCVWEWIISQIILGKKVPDVLKEAGLWWRKKKIANKVQKLQNARQRPHNKRASSEMREDNHSERSASSHQDAGPTWTDIGMQEDYSPEGSGSNQLDVEMREDNNNPNGSESTARNTLQPSTQPLSLPVPSNVQNEVENALYRFIQFWRHGSINRYEAEMKDYYSLDYATVIREHVESLRAQDETDNPMPPLGLFDTFANGLKAIAARKEAEREQEELL